MSRKSADEGLSKSETMHEPRYYNTNANNNSFTNNNNYSSNNNATNNTNTSDKSSSSLNCCGDLYFPKRFILLMLLFFGMIIINAQRVNIGVTVVAILHKTAPTRVSDPRSLAAIANLNWSNGMVGLLHSMFYIGIFISQVPCGYIVTKFPSHRCFGICVVSSCLLNFLLPVSIVYAGYALTCIIRLAQGLVEGMLYPSCYDVLRIWSLPEEKSRMGATVLTGSYIGPTLGMIFSGLLTYYWGWVFVFYVHGAAGVVWFAFWLYLAYESPRKHKTISPDELKLIEARQGEAAVIYEESAVPWKAIFSSLPVYSLIICNFARSSIFYMLLTNQPTYFHLFEFSFVENGLFSSLPHAFMALFCIISGSLADLLLNRPNVTATFVRKLFTGIGFGVEGLLFYALALVDGKVAAVTVLTIAVGISGLAISGWQINHLDIAPRYAGILVAITMTFGTLAGVINPLIVAYMTEDQSLASWHNVFWMTGSILLFATLFYVIFGSGERQSWSSPSPPTMRVINSNDFTENNNRPYGTFAAQAVFDGAIISDPAMLVNVKNANLNDDNNNDNNNNNNDGEAVKELKRRSISRSGDV